MSAQSGSAEAAPDQQQSPSEPDRQAQADNEKSDKGNDKDNSSGNGDHKGNQSAERNRPGKLPLIILGASSSCWQSSRSSGGSRPATR